MKLLKVHGYKINKLISRNGSSLEGENGYVQLAKYSPGLK